MLLQGADGLHKPPLKAVADAHDLPGRFHLGRQRSSGADELIKGQAWHFHHTVVQHGLKAGHGLPGNGIFDLIQRVAHSDLCGNLGDGIARCLGRQSRGPAYPGIYLDDAVFKALRMKGELYVAASCDLQLADDIEGR